MVAILLLADVTTVLTSGLVAALARFGRLDEPLVLTGSLGSTTYFVLSITVALAWPLFFAMERLYDTERLFWGSGEFRRMIRGVTLGVFGIVSANYVLKLPGISRQWMAMTWALAVIIAPLGRQACRVIIGNMRASGCLQRPTLIVGSSGDAARFARVIQRDSRTGMRLIGCLAATQGALDDLPSEIVENVPVIGYAGELTQRLVETGADTLVIVSPDFDHDVLSRMLSEVRLIPVSVHISSGLFEVLASRVLVRELNGVPVMVVRGGMLTHSQMLLKRAFDVVISSVGILVGMPVWLVVMAAIKLDSRGPVFYLQRRVGHKGEPFRMFKFRSMLVDAEERLADLQGTNEADGPLFKMKADPRITRVGQWLRKYSIDEFPQLLNVIVGDMSLVGPRPPLPCEVDLYEGHHWKRLETLPGMTGLWQVSGRSDLSFEEMVRLDVFYIENWSMAFDFTILLRTIPAVVFRRGAY